MTIPVNLITGFLGVGKTTAVIDLLKNKAAGSRWAVLVNEYGDVSIDGAMIEGSAPDGVSVREVGGGCVCCATAPYLPVAIHFLLLDAKPDRLIIETTGLGHPARLLDMLRQNYADRLDVRATLGIVDPADFAKPEMRENPIFVDQVQLADVVVMNKLDTATPELVSDFQRWAEGLFPPKLLIAGTTHGRLDPAWLDLSANDERLPLFPEAHAHHHHHDASPPIAMGGLTAKKGAPVRYPSPPGVKPACCGWVFDAADVFDENRLLSLLAGTKGVSRLKGVFHLPDEWEAVNRSGTAVSVAPTAYRRDSRLEVFSDALDWAAFERELVGCLLAPVARQ
ncbi:Cobalamin synthesis protein, P47K OS=Rhodopirellula baltica SWK14 GN=RBSWK_03034 PE=4 SV=1: cobW: CobW_C [Gemmataceae bacterium]|nr:Cobalamin synthesis protein, P47K OS=Rhodopirellula baltica SWK14 GN=RBSWK_03034 PE=4 SV=1: cobW: CobW_C [Gemmataceae bacterium]VTT99200.1 Cobalamin synthesis protein, P47K OS=Rhodopirellula baltica SWK14 GN=RBSWK_03034 PE=4 SV=1: cobW: CobW_C [Gemmataceae bacterium]